jgi:uncharacterized protein (TIGR02421 family)
VSPTERAGPPQVELSAGDLAADHLLTQISGGVRFLLDVTPVDAQDVSETFLDGDQDEPEFTYRDLETDPDVLEAELDLIDLGGVEDRTLGELLRSKDREIRLQLEMLRARGTRDFAALSVELYGAVGPTLREQAEGLMASLARSPTPGQLLDAQQFLTLAESEIEHYRQLDPDVGIHAEVRPDVSGVLVEGDTLLISEDATIPAVRAPALLQHEVGTHLVTQVNGSGQPIKLLGTGLAGYDETQEGLAVLAEILVGGLTPFRLRQLAARVLTVHRLINGATFREAHQSLVEAGIPGRAAFTTTMRVYRSGGLTKDAIYLRGLLDLLGHVAQGGALDLFYLGKFALRDLPLVQDLHERGVLCPPRIMPRYLADPEAVQRLQEAATADDLTTLTKGSS